MKRSGLRRKTPLRRTGRLGSNPERKARRFAKDFGPLAEFVRERDCAVCHLYFSVQTSPTQACHIKSRGAGNHAWNPDGTSNLFPQCHEHHSFQHQHGWAELLYPAREDMAWVKCIAKGIGEEFLAQGGEIY